MVRQPFDIRDSRAGYCPVSIFLHWLTVVAVAILYLSQARAWSAIHIGTGLIAAPVFLFRIYWRIKRGYPRVPDQPIALNFAERLVTISILACLFAIAVTGILIPPLDGNAVSLFGLFSIDAPLPSNPELASWAKRIHQASTSSIIPLIGLHVLGALVHRLAWKDGTLARMRRSTPGGR